MKSRRKIFCSKTEFADSAAAVRDTVKCFRAPGTRGESFYGDKKKPRRKRHGSLVCADESACIEQFLKAAINHYVRRTVARPGIHADRPIETAPQKVCKRGR